jgi:hypothetical protein
MQEPAKKPRPDADTSVIGQPQESVLKGSRLAQNIKADGGDPNDGKTEKAKKVEISDSRLSQISKGKRLIHEFAWPGTDWKCGVVVLTTEEIEESAIWASERLKDARHNMDAVSYNERLAQENMIQVAWRATVDPETGHPWALNPDELRRLVDTETLAFVVAVYNDWQDRTSPLTSPGLTDAEFNVIIEALKKNPKDPLIDGLDAVSLRTLARSMASLITS